MRFWYLMVAATVAGLAGCAEEPRTDLVGEANELAKVIAAEQDHVSVPELSDWIIKEKGDFILVDIREESDFTAGHIRTARHIPLATLVSDASLEALPEGSKVVVYSNGTAHGHAAALLLRLVDREAYALLGGYNYWQAYLNDPVAAGVAEMDPAERAEYQAVACYFEGDYVADAGLVPKGAGAGTPAAGGEEETAAAGDDLGLGLGLGLGSEEVRESRAEESAGSGGGDALGLGLGLGGDEKEEKSTRKLLIKAEC